MSRRNNESVRNVGAVLTILMGIGACEPYRPATVPDELIEPEEEPLVEPIEPLDTEPIEPLEPIDSMDIMDLSEPTEPEQSELDELDMLDELEPVAGRVVDINRYVLAPGDYAGYTVQGTARVAEVVSDRGFWITDGHSRTFAILREDTPDADQRLEINAGQLIRFEGRALTSSALEGLALDLEPATRSRIEQEPGFIVLRWTDVMILDRDPGDD